MKKRLIILLALLLIAIAIFIPDRYGDKFLPAKLNAEKIETVEISYDKPVIIEEPRPYQHMHEYVEYIESRKADFDGEPFENIPVYRYEDMINVGDCSIFVGRDNGYYKFYSGRIINPAFGLFSVFPTDAIREVSSDESVYAVYDTDIGMRMYLFYSKEKNNYVVLDGFPIIMSKVLEYKDFADISIGDSSSEVQAIDPVTLLHTQLWDEVKDDMISVRTEDGRGPTSVHLLKDGILKIEYNRTESGEYEIIDIEYNEDFILTGFDGDTCYKISELDYPPKVKGRASIILSKENNADEIAEITRLYNESVQHHDHGVGTTHPTHVRITCNNGKEISFWCGVGDFITTAKGKRQYNYVNGELDEYIGEMISAWAEENFFVGDANLTIVKDDLSIQPYRNFLSCTTYYEGEWLCADGMGAYFLLMEKEDELPVVLYDGMMEFIISNDAKVLGVSLFDANRGRTHHRIDEAEFFELCKNLDSGTYYVSVAVSYKGKYIEKEDKYESFADEYIFRMDVEKSAENLISQRISDYTRNYFRFTEEVVTESQGDNVSISVKFVPEVGSIIVKEELYENIASHAYQITRFCAEVNHFDYLVLWDDYSKEEALFLTIGKEAVINLESIYINQLINRNGGLKTHFAEVFSEIVETEESMTWRDRIDPDAELP